MSTKMRWGDSLDDDDDTLPPSEVIGPDKNGVKQIIDYSKNETGETIKTTTKVKIIKVEKKIYQVRRQYCSLLTFQITFIRRSGFL